MSSENGLAQHYEAVLSHLRHIAGVYAGEARFDDALRILRYAEQIVKEADVAQADRTCLDAARHNPDGTRVVRYGRVR